MSTPEEIESLARLAGVDKEAVQAAVASLRFGVIADDPNLTGAVGSIDAPLKIPAGRIFVALEGWVDSFAIDTTAAPNTANLQSRTDLPLFEAAFNVVYQGETQMPGVAAVVSTDLRTLCGKIFYMFPEGEHTVNVGVRDSNNDIYADAAQWTMALVLRGYLLPAAAAQVLTGNQMRFL
jgi:hypothetical protein